MVFEYKPPKKKSLFDNIKVVSDNIVKDPLSFLPTNILAKTVKKAVKKAKTKSKASKIGQSKGPAGGPVSITTPKPKTTNQPKYAHPIYKVPEHLKEFLVRPKYKKGGIAKSKKK
tara:strand:+ start:464 stop:808 length:345 start_codon:yes stop_codon:yes gene_type:complete